MDDKPIFKGRGPGVPGVFTGEEVVSEETIKELARRINGGHTMLSKQTAVEWLVDKLMRESTGHISLDALSSYTQQALEIEKEQIMAACKHGDITLGFVDYILQSQDDAERYYNETYNK